MEIILNIALPMNIVKHIKDFIPKDRYMKSPVSVLLDHDKCGGRFRTGPNQYYGYNRHRIISRHRLISSNNFWMARQYILKAIHIRDLYYTKHCDNYMSVLCRYDIEEIVRGRTERFKHYLPELYN